MGAAAATRYPNPITAEMSNAELPLLDERAGNNVPARSQLIETIKNNVMAWTKWKASDGANKSTGLSEPGRAH